MQPGLNNMVYDKDVDFVSIMSGKRKNFVRKKLNGVGQLSKRCSLIRMNNHA